MGPQPLSCGNGLTPSGLESTLPASMGPQPLSCGNSVPSSRSTRRTSRFNGAAASQLRK